MPARWQPASWHCSPILPSRRARSPPARSAAFQYRVSSVSNPIESMFALVRTKTKRCGGSIHMRACRSKLPLNLKTGGVSAIGKVPKAGSIIHCYPVSAQQWCFLGPRTSLCRCSRVRTSSRPLQPNCNPACSERSSPAMATGANSAGRALKVTSGKNVCGVPIRTRKWTNSRTVVLQRKGRDRPGHSNKICDC